MREIARGFVITHHNTKILSKAALYFMQSNFMLKGATQLYFMFCFCLVIILLSTGLYKSAFTTHKFGKTSFPVFLYLRVLIFSFALCFEFNVFPKT